MDAQILSVKVEKKISCHNSFVAIGNFYLFLLLYLVTKK